LSIPFTEAFVKKPFLESREDYFIVYYGTMGAADLFEQTGALKCSRCQFHRLRLWQTKKRHIQGEENSLQESGENRFQIVHKVEDRQWKNREMV